MIPLLLKAIDPESEFSAELNTVTEFYGEDFSRHTLEGHLEMLRSNYNGERSLTDIVKYCRSLTPAQRLLMAEAAKLVRLLMTVPATNAQSERMFSALRRIKTYLRATMKQDRLNHLMVMSVHKDKVDSLQWKTIASEFVNGVEERVRVFGKIQPV